MIALSALVPAPEEALVRTRAALLECDARQARWSGGRRPGSGLSERVCLVVAAIAPRLPYERLTVLVRYSLWTFLLDDEFDRPEADLDGLERLGAAVVAATEGRAGPDGDPLAAELAAIVERLAAFDPDGRAVHEFGAALRRAVDGEVRQARLARSVARGVASPPAAADYLAVAAHTVNYLSFAYALLAVRPGQLPPAGPLATALWHAACAIRLANDLRSESRDRAEGRLNVLGLPTGAGPATRRWARRAIDEQLRAHDTALARFSPEHAATAAALRRSTRVSVGFYRLSDLR